jgi:competence protein ComEA
MGQLTRGQTIGIVALLAIVTGWVGVTALHNGPPSASPGIVVRQSSPIAAAIPNSVAPLAVGPAPGNLVPVPPPDTAPPAAEIVVHVAGAVKRPGVYHLKPGARNVEAVNAAGGFSSAANPDAINLAAHSEDGSQLYIPSRAEQPSGGMAAREPGSKTSVPAFASGVMPPRTSEVKGGPHGGRSSGKFSDPSQGQVDLNTADAAQLQHVPGIGPAMAERILAYRRTAGRFQSTDDLLQLPGIGDKTYQKMRPYLSVR